MKYSNDKITLRPLERADIADRLRWETEETEWQLWDGPWEYEGRTGGERAEKAAALERRLLARLAEEEPEDGFPMGLEICINHPAQTHIGWCSAYTIDEDCCISDLGDRYAVGICVPPRSMRRKGYAAASLTLYLQCLLESGLSEIYTQTWSGNLSMLGLAEKLGFEEYLRKPGFRTVRGGVYDGLTFRLNLEKFYHQ